jgi:hypothetical protein
MQMAYRELGEALQKGYITKRARRNLVSGGLDTGLTRRYVGWAPGPCSADSLGFGIDELAKDAHMSGYVGMDVHRTPPRSPSWMMLASSSATAASPTTRPS